MDFLNKQFKQIGSHLGGLTGSQRLVLVLCVVLLVGSAAWFYQWSGQAEMVPLLDQPMKPNELTNIEGQLASMGQKFRTVGGQIMIPVDDRTRVQGVVAQQGLMPADTSIGFSKLIEESNMWIPREESRWQRKIALGNELAKVLGTFDGVTDAKVFIDSPERRGFGESASAPTASVFLRTRQGVTLDKARIAAIASLVSGAVNGLRPDAVRIVDATTGRPYRVPNEEDALPYDMMDLRRQKEDHFGRKILSQLSYIPGVLVGVNVDLDSDRRHERKEKYGPPVPSEEESRTSETSNNTPAQSPGVKPNTRAMVMTPGSVESSNTEETRTSLLGERDKQITETEVSPGVVRAVTASINIPRSYFVNVFRQLHAGKEPTEKDLEPIISGEEKKVRGQVKPLIAAANDAQVEVSWFFDSAAPAAAEVPAETRPTSVAAMMREHGKPVALGVLAVLSVLVVVQMARRATLGPVGTAGALQPALAGGGAAMAAVESTGGDAFGTAAATPSARREVMMPEPDLDEAMERVQAIVREITKEVGAEPEVAGSILDRWMSQQR